MFGCPPVHQPTQIREETLELMAPPLLVMAPPLLVMAPPLLVMAPPLLVMAPPLLVMAPPLLVMAPPLLVMAPPLLVMAPTLLVMAPPLLVMAPTLLVMAPPLLVIAPPLLVMAPPLLVIAPPILCLILVFCCTITVPSHPGHGTVHRGRYGLARRTGAEFVRTRVFVVRCLRYSVGGDVAVRCGVRRGRYREGSPFVGGVRPSVELSPERPCLSVPHDEPHQLWTGRGRRAQWSGECRSLLFIYKRTEVRSNSICFHLFLLVWISHSFHLINSIIIIIIIIAIHF